MGRVARRAAPPGTPGKGVRKGERTMSASNGSGLREKVAFETNTPVLLRLDYDEGKLSPGKFGDQYQCTFDNGAKIAWLDPEVHALIIQTGARAGDEIAITKREVRDGNRKRARWEVEKVEDEANAAFEAEYDARNNTRRPAAPKPAAQQPAPPKQAAAPRNAH